MDFSGTAPFPISFPKHDNYHYNFPMLDAGGCRFIIGSPGEHNYCSVDRQTGSSYCAHHDALCHIRPKSAQERAALREIAALAAKVGGKLGRRQLSEAQLRGLAAVGRKGAAAGA